MCMAQKVVFSLTKSTYIGYSLLALAVLGNWHHGSNYVGRLNLKRRLKESEQIARLSQFQDN